MWTGSGTASACPSRQPPHSNALLFRQVSSPAQQCLVMWTPVLDHAMPVGSAGHAFPSGVAQCCFASQITEFPEQALLPLRCWQ